MLGKLRRAGAWVAYRLIRAYWWIRRPVILGVRVLVVEENQVLLVNHSYRDGWFLPGGAPESGESLAATARREVQEETGVAIRVVTLLGIYSSHAGPAKDHTVVFAGKPQDTDTAKEDCTVKSLANNPEIECVQWAPAKHPPEGTSDQAQLIIDDWLQGRIATYRVVHEAEDTGISIF